MAIQAGVSVVAALTIFPESVGHSFQTKLVGVLSPLCTAMVSIESLFGEADLPADPATEDDPDQALSTTHAEKLEMWAVRAKAIRIELLQSLGGLPPLRAQQRYLAVDFSYSRLRGRDLRDLFDLLAACQVRSGGLAFFFDVIIANARHSHLDSSAFSVHNSRFASREPSVRGSEDGSEDDTSRRKIHLPAFLHRHSGSYTDLHKGGSLLDSLRKTQQPVGVYESQRYMDVERAFSK
jgi:hypothetical protein